MKINIPLDPELAASLAPDFELPKGADIKLVQYQYYLDKLGLALASDKGIKLTYPTHEDAKGARFKFYRARRYVARQGIASFNSVTLTVSGCELFLRKDNPPEVELL